MERSLLKSFWLILLLITLSSCSSQSAKSPISKADTRPLPSTNSVATLTTDNSEKPAIANEMELEPEPNSNNLWQHFAEKLTLANTHKDDIQSALQWYKNNASALKQSETNMRYFLYFVLDELDKQNLPADIALIPVIESHYNPKARGNGPLGMWQFMPATARNFKLTSSNAYDGRMDPIASTKAATHYFRYLMDYFNNDFLLAVAAYNAGEGTVSNAIRYNRQRGLATDFWSLKLPSHTRNYVMRLIALSTIYHSPEDYSLQYAYAENAATFTTVTIKRGITVEEICQTIGMAYSEFTLLNAGLKDIRLITSSEFPIQILANTSEEKQQALSNVIRHGFLLPRYYQVRQGDTLGRIANKFQTTTTQIKHLNKLKNDTIRINQTLVVGMTLQK